MTSEEKNFDKCLKLLSNQWPKLVDRIRNADTDHLKETRTELDEFNIFYQKDNLSVPIHSQEGALLDSERFFQSQSLHQGYNTIFFFGLGAGYDYLAVKDWLEENPERLLVIIEDDYGIINKFFKSNLAVTLLSDPQVLLVPCESKVDSKEIQFPIGFEMILHVGLRENYVIVFSKFNQEQRIEFCQALKQYLHLRIQDFMWLNSFTDKKMVKRTFTNVIYNLHTLSEMSRGSDLCKKFRGIPSLICAAGPSIKSQLPHIKKLKNRAIIFGAGTGMNTLNAEGILPHFGCGIDPHRSSESRMLTNTAFSVPYFHIMQFNHDAASLIHGERLFIRETENYRSIRWMISELSLENSVLHFNISTTSACLAVADMLGCEPLVFLGLDLSYTDDKRYLDEIDAHPTDKPLESELISELPNNRLIPLVNSKGKRIYTRSDWISEGTYYALFANKNPQLKILNATMEGLDIKGIEAVPLQKLERDYLGIGYDLDNWIHAEIIRSIAMPVTDQMVDGKIEEWNQSLQRGEKILRDMIKDLLDYDKIENKDFDKLGSDQFDKLEDLLKQEVIYSTLVEELDFAFEKNKMRDVVFLKFHSHLLEPEERYQRLLMIELYRLKYLHKFVELQLKVIGRFYEMKNTESVSCKPVQQVTIPQIENVFDGNQLVISDQELGIKLEEKFSPERVQKKPERIDQEAQFVYASCENGVPNGECLLYDGEGWLKGRWYYQEGMLHGPSQLFGPEGELLAEGWFFNDERQGINLQYYPSGSLYSIQRFKDEIQQGKQEFFYENGQLKTLYSYNDGCFNGKVELYYPNGYLKRELTYSNGKRHGMERHWLENGQLLRESEYDHDSPMGTARHWYPNGQLKTEKIYVDDAGHFDLRNWSQSGKLIKEQIYLPERISDDFVESQTKRSSALEKLKKKMEGLVDGKHSG